MAIVMMQRAKRLTCCPITLTFTFNFNWNFLCFHSAANIEDHQTLYRVLEACKHSFNSATATQTHARIIKFGYGAYPSLVAILISTYAHCHRLNLARRLIHQIFSWDFDLVSVNIVIERLMRIGECNFAKKVFDKMPTRDTVTWNSVIGGYVKNARFEEALTFFREMLSSNVEPDAFTFASILTGCARLGALNHAYWLKLVDKNSKEAEFAKSALFSKHAEMKDWPEDHSFQLFKLEIENIFLIDWFGSPKPLTLDQYLHTSLNQYLECSLNCQSLMCFYIGCQCELKLVDKNSKEAEFAKSALFSKHAEMKDWPEDHSFQLFKLEIENIFLIDWFGSPKPLTLDQYLHTSL
nr:pentatricopeptide repeat-containing protein [Quercus suber]